MKLKIILLSCLWVVSALPSVAESRSAVIHVDGLTCPFCAYGVEKKIREVPGVKSVTIRMRTGEVEVGYKDGVTPDPDALRNAVIRAGFTPREIRLIGETARPAARRPDVVAGFAGPVGAVRGPDGALYLSEAQVHRIIRIDPNGETKVIAANLERPMHFALRDGRLYVPEFVADRIAVLDADNGERLTTLGDSAIFDGPAGVAISRAGRIYVADFYGHRIVVLSETGAFIRAIGKEGYDAGELYYPTDLAFGLDGHLFVADAYNHRIQVFTIEGEHVRAWGKQGVGRGEFQIIEGLDISVEGRVLAADAENGRIQVFDLDGNYRGAWLGLDYPVEVVALPNGDATAVLNHAGEVRILRKEALR